MVKSRIQESGVRIQNKTIKAFTTEGTQNIENGLNSLKFLNQKPETIN
jgi:hypothetical protein